MTERTPAMSVILPTIDDFSTIRRTVRALGAQTIADQLELVIVAPRANIVVPPAALEPFASTQVIGIGPFWLSNAARVAGIREARAPIVVMSEDHCFPDPDWAEALLAAHRPGRAAVGPALRNANPATAVSWANFLPEYGEWIGAERGVRGALPGHNSSYRRELLLEFGDELEDVFEAESVVQELLRQQGGELYLEPAARAAHWDYSRWAPSMLLRFNGGRMFAGYRMQQWPVWRRLLYILGAPLIPFVRARRLLGILWGASDVPISFWRIAPVLCVMLALDALGELVGYTFGAGRSGELLCSIEFNRERFLIPSERAAFRGEEEFAHEPVGVG